MTIKGIRSSFNSRRAQIAAIMVLSFASATTVAADYSVGIVGLGTSVGGGGTAINLYRTTEKGTALVQHYVLQQVDFTGGLSSPLTLAISPAHDFVYVAYTGTGLPNIVGFKIAPQSLIKVWEHTLSTGDATLQGTTLIAFDKHLIENTYPCCSSELWIHVLTESGQEVVSDTGSNGTDLISGHIDPQGHLYYSCRYMNTPSNSINGPANSVAVYDLDRGAVSPGAPPLFASSDPTFVQSICVF